MTWLYQHHDYGNIEGFTDIDGDSGNTGDQEAVKEIKIIEEYGQNTLRLTIYYVIFLGFIFLGGPWIFYYFILVRNNYFPMYLSYKTDIISRGNDVVPADKPALVRIKKLYSKVNQTEGDTIQQENLNVCFLDLPASVPKTKDFPGIPAPRIKMSLNMTAYDRLYPTPVSGFGDDKVVNKITLQNLFSRWFLNMISYTLMWYFKITYMMSNLPVIVYFILIIALISTVSVINDLSAGSIVKHLSLVTGGSISYLLFTVLAVICGMFSCSAALIRFNPDNTAQTTQSFQKDVAYLFLFNFMQVYNPDGSWGAWFTVVFSGILRLGLMFLLGFYTLTIAAILPIFGIFTIWYFLIQPTGVYYVNGKEKPLNIFHAHYLFYKYISTCRGFIECMLIVLILFAFLVEAKNTTYNGFGLAVLFGTCIFWFFLRLIGGHNYKYATLKHLHTETDEEPSISDIYTNDEISQETPMNKPSVVEHFNSIFNNTDKTNSNSIIASNEESSTNKPDNAIGSSSQTETIRVKPEDVANTSTSSTENKSTTFGEGSPHTILSSEDNERRIKDGSLPEDLAIRQEYNPYKLSESEPIPETTLPKTLEDQPEPPKTSETKTESPKTSETKTESPKTSETKTDITPKAHEDKPNPTLSEKNTSSKQNPKLSESK